MPRAMVLAAGLGTRLRPLTNTIPKPLLPFGDRPLIEHAFGAVQRAGLGPEVVVNTHHLPEAFDRSRASFSLGVAFSHEAALLGTAGGIARARPLFAAETVVVLTSDVVLEKLPRALVEAATGGMTLAVAPRARGAGTVGLGEDGQVVRLRGQHFGEEVAGGEYVGAMALGREALAEMPAIGCYIADYALPYLARGGRILTVPYEHDFVIAGDDVPTFFEENLRWLERERAGESYVAARAAVGARVQLDRSIVGADAWLGGEGRVARSVIFPGARCTAPIAGALVSPTLTLKVALAS